MFLIYFFFLVKRKNFIVYHPYRTFYERNKIWIISDSDRYYQLCQLQQLQSRIKGKAKINRKDSPRNSKKKKTKKENTLVEILISFTTLLQQQSQLVSYYYYQQSELYLIGQLLLLQQGSSQKIFNLFIKRIGCGPYHIPHTTSKLEARQQLASQLFFSPQLKFFDPRPI